MDAMSEHNDLLPLRSPEEGGPAFELVRRGYDRDQVDNHLGWLEDQLRNAEIARDAAEHAAASAAAEAEAAREELESGRPQWHEFGDRITEILNLAEEQGAQIRAQRSQEADELLQEARQLSADTERDCAQRVREAEATSTQIVSDAQAKAEDILTTAQAEADRLTMRTQQETAELERAVLAAAGRPRASARRRQRAAHAHARGPAERSGARRSRSMIPASRRCTARRGRVRDRRATATPTTKTTTSSASPRCPGVSRRPPPSLQSRRSVGRLPSVDDERLTRQVRRRV